MTTSQPAGHWPDYFRMGLQYYVTGRYSYFVAFSPVTGNLFHHAVELFLKSSLLKREVFTPDQLRRRFHHHLASLWQAYKVRVNDPELDQFDPLIARLNDFEDLWYPRLAYQEVSRP